jgi:hypothetical protein
METPASSDPKTKPKLKYEKPALKSESLTAVAALCNGTTTASRKATAPVPCSSSKLKS